MIARNRFSAITLSMAARSFPARGYAGAEIQADQRNCVNTGKGTKPKRPRVRVPRLDTSGFDIANLILGTWLPWHKTSGFDLVIQIPGPKSKKERRALTIKTATPHTEGWN